MQETREKGNTQDYKSNVNVAAWYNIDKNGNTYLSVVLENRVNLFPVEKEIEPKEVDDIFD